MEGWIKLHRSIADHWTFDDPVHFKWWILILLNVNIKVNNIPDGKGFILCKEGQSFRSIEGWSRLFGCAKKTTIKFFKMLQKDDMILIKIIGNGNQRKHLLTVVNWAKFQIMETEVYPERKPKFTLNGNPTLPPKEEGKKERRKEYKTPFIPQGEEEIDFKFLDTVKEDWRPLVKYWIEYKKEKKQAYRGMIALKTMLGKLKKISGDDLQKAKQIIEMAITGNYTSFSELKTDSKKSKGYTYGEMTLQLNASVKMDDFERVVENGSPMYYRKQLQNQL